VVVWSSLRESQVESFGFLVIKSLDEVLFYITVLDYSLFWLKKSKVEDC
jgi:hypothetical protein